MSAAATPPRTRHATAHNAETGHPVIESFEPGENWAFCYSDTDVLETVAPEVQRSY